MASRQQRVPPSRLAEPNLHPNPPRRVPPRASLQAPQPLLARPLRLPQTRRRRRFAHSPRRRRFDVASQVAQPEPRHRGSSQGAGDAGSSVPRSGASRRVSLLGVRRQGGGGAFRRGGDQGAEDGQMLEPKRRRIGEDRRRVQ